MKLIKLFWREKKINVLLFYMCFLASPPPPLPADSMHCDILSLCTVRPLLTPPFTPVEREKSSVSPNSRLAQTDRNMSAFGGDYFKRQKNTVRCNLVLVRADVSSSGGE